MPDTKIARFETKAVDPDTRTFTGLAATWDLDLGGDIIERGAFKRTLGSWKSTGRIVPLLDSHSGHTSVRSAVGKMEDAEETDAGLQATFRVINGPDGEEIFRRVEGGYVDGLSIGYSAMKVRYPETEDEKAKGIWRYLEEVKLHEVSVCLWPMNPNARIDQNAAKALIAVASTRALTDDEKDVLRVLSKDIGALLEPDPDSGGGPAPDMLDNLSVRIQQLHAKRLAARIREILERGAC